VPVLVGEIATLRPIDPQAHAASYYDYNLDPEMHLWTGNRVLGSPHEARKELARLCALDEFTMWAIVDNATGAMIGRFFVCLEERDGKTVAGEGVRIAKPFWRKGHNREARHLALQYVFDVLHADCMETECWTENTNCRLSLLASGFTQTAEVTEFNPNYGREMAKSVFVLTRRTWEKASP